MLHLQSGFSESAVHIQPQHPMFALSNLRNRMQVIHRNEFWIRR